jgi:hypothetical protein
MIRRGKGMPPFTPTISRRVARGLRWTLAAVAAVAVTALGAVSVGAAWDDRARDVCRDEAPLGSTGYSTRWQWGQFAYVCDYRGTGGEQRRVGLVDAFHGEEARRHRPAR